MTDASRKRLGELLRQIPHQRAELRRLEQLNQRLKKGPVKGANSAQVAEDLQKARASLQALNDEADLIRRGKWTPPVPPTAEEVQAAKLQAAAQFLQEPVTPGLIVKMEFFARPIQIINGTTMLLRVGVRYPTRDRFNTVVWDAKDMTFWVEGVNTAGMVDDQPIDLRNTVFKVGEPKQYTNAAGSTSTVVRLQPVK